MIRILIAKVDNMQQYNVNRKMKIIRKSKRNVQNQKHYNRNEECLSWAHYTLNMAEERISEFEDMTVEASQTQSKEKNDWRKKRTEYLGTVRQLQKV